MPRSPESMSDDNLRRIIGVLRESIASGERAAVALAGRVTTIEEAGTGTLTDNTPRWIALSVPYTLFTPSVGLMSVDVTLTTLPPGAVWTAARIDVGTNYVSAGAIWRMQVKVPVGGASIGGTAKNPDVTTPDTLDLRSSDEIVMSDPAGVCDVVVNLDNGVDTADQLISGDVTVNLLVSVPGATTSLLPAS